MRTGIVYANIFTGYAAAKQSLPLILVRRITLSSKKFQLNILGVIADKIHQLFIFGETFYHQFIIYTLYYGQSHIVPTLFSLHRLLS